VSKVASDALLAYMAADVTTLCTIWKVTRTDDVVLGFTDHDQDITYSGVTYYAETGYTRSAIQSDSMLSVDNMEVTGILNSSYIDEHDLRNGVYNYARVDIYLVNWNDLTAGDMQLRRGWFGEVVVTPVGTFTTELRGLTQALMSNFGATIQALCRADFGDTTGCHIPIDPPLWEPDMVYGPNTWIVAPMYTGDDVTIDPYMGTIWNTSASAGKGTEPTHGGGTSGSSPPNWFPGIILLQSRSIAWVGASAFQITSATDYSPALTIGIDFQTSGFTHSGNNGIFTVVSCTYSGGVNVIAVSQTTGVVEGDTPGSEFSEIQSGDISIVGTSLAWHANNAFYITSATNYSSTLNTAGLRFHTSGFTNAGNNGIFTIVSCIYTSGVNEITVEQTTGVAESGGSGAAFSEIGNTAVVADLTVLAWTGASTLQITSATDYSSVLTSGVPFQTNGFTNVGNNGGFVTVSCVYATGVNTITVAQTTGISELGGPSATFVETATGVIAPVSDNGITWHPANSFTKQGTVTGATNNKIFTVSGLTIPTDELYGPLVNALNVSYPVYGPHPGGPFSPGSVYNAAHPTDNTLTVHLIANNGNTINLDINVPGGGPINIINVHNNDSSNVDFQGNLSSVTAVITGDSPNAAGINWIDNAVQTGTLTITVADTHGNSWADVIQMPPVSTYYAGAILWFITGPNAGKSIEVKSFADDTITTWISLPWLPSAGDIFRIYPGCDKRRSTCQQFGNAVNFQGEPDLPGQDFLYAPNISF